MLLESSVHFPILVDQTSFWKAANAYCDCAASEYSPAAFRLDEGLGIIDWTSEDGAKVNDIMEVM